MDRDIAAVVAPADLVETVARAVYRIIGLDPDEAVPELGGAPQWQIITQDKHLNDLVAALAGRIVPEGYVAVPLDDLRLALNRGGTIDGLNAFGRLRAIAGSDVIGQGICS